MPTISLCPFTSNWTVPYVSYSAFVMLALSPPHTSFWPGFLSKRLTSELENVHAGRRKACLGIRSCGFQTSTFSSSDVVPSSLKEVEYFSDPKHYALGMAWYRTHFPGTVCRYRLLKRRGFNAVSGEATQRYFANPDVPGRMRRVLPDVRLIVILRNPVERAYSEYRMRLRNQRESRSFEDAINGEKKSLSGGEEISWDPDGSFRYYTSYLRKGHYADHLANWFGHYDRSRFLLLSTERIGADPQGTLDKSFEFLGLEPFEAGGLKNSNVGTYEGMNPDTRRMLVDHFRPHNERLYRLLEEEGGGGGTKHTFDWDR